MYQLVFCVNALEITKHIFSVKSAVQSEDASQAGAIGGGFAAVIIVLIVVVAFIFYKYDLFYCNFTHARLRRIVGWRNSPTTSSIKFFTCLFVMSMD